MYIWLLLVEKTTARVNFNEEDEGESSGDDEGGEGETNIEFQKAKHEDERDYDEPEIEEYQKSDDEAGQLWYKYIYLT